MKRFRFSLQQVLNLKTSQKYQIENEMAALQRQKLNIESNLNDLTNQWQAEQRALAMGAGRKIDADYRIRMGYLDFIDQQIVVENKTLLNVVKQISTTRERLAIVIQEEKVIKKLRDRRYEEHVAAAQKEEQNITDDMVNQRVVQDILRSTLQDK
ncbi:MAG: flagellar export protein FliJ [Deferribacteres bacterium]|nr:flagellar export protein FliJ [candidate division KSB1 bacterium]MCB9501925.1 flagellar export protein FliJ [Deferribacteres bacterium]